MEVAVGVLARNVADASVEAIDQQDSMVTPFCRKAAPLRIVIVGGGFAGIEAASRLGRLLRGDDSAQVILISSENYFLFQPLLPEVVACSIEPSHIQIGRAHV